MEEIFKPYTRIIFRWGQENFKRMLIMVRLFPLCGTPEVTKSYGNCGFRAGKSVTAVRTLQGLGWIWMMRYLLTLLTDVYLSADNADSVLFEISFDLFLFFLGGGWIRKYSLAVRMVRMKLHRLQNRRLIHINIHPTHPPIHIFKRSTHRLPVKTTSLRFLS